MYLILVVSCVLEYKIFRFAIKKVRVGGKKLGSVGIPETNYFFVRPNNNNNNKNNNNRIPLLMVLFVL